MRKFLIAGLLATAATAAGAAPLLTNAGFSTDATVIGFDGLSAGTIVTDQYAAQGLTVSGDPITIGNGSYSDAPNISGSSYFDSFSAGQDSTDGVFNFVFGSTVTRAGMFLEFNAPTTARLTALLGGAEVETFTITNNDCCDTATFYGFSDIAFDTIRLDQVAGRDFYGDSVTFDAVPEPAMLGLFGLGAIGLGLARRRRG